MKNENYKKAFDHLTATAYQFGLSINDDPEWKLRMTDKQREHLRGMVMFLLRSVDEAEKEADHEPIKVKVKRKRKN